MHRAIKRSAFVGIVLLLGSVAAAQNAAPVMFAKPEPGKPLTPLTLSAVDIRVRVIGRVAETSTTMTFANPLDRELEGELYFPLPQGATVSGYALDIEGSMVDGVAVEKDRGREVFETIVRRGIDPGLVEWVNGNNFKTRVYPILAGRSRTIRVSYVSEISGPNGKQTYRLPLNYKQEVARFALRVEVVRPAKTPQITGGDLANFTFDKWSDGFAAETKLTDATLTKDLVIALPDIAAGNVMIEKAGDGKYYFAINDTAAIPRRKSKPPRPKRVCVLWDASGSRGDADHKREIELLKKCLDSMLPAGAKSQAKQFAVDLVIFRNKCAEPKSFTWDGLNWTKNASLLKTLKNIQYDGGTQIGAITPWPEAKTPDMYLLFTDGISNFGRETPGAMTAPIYAFSSDGDSNHTLLTRLAMKSGGQYFNLKRTTDQHVVASIGRSCFSFMSAGASKIQTDELYPSCPQPVYPHTPFLLVGRLTAETATVTLNYGFTNKTAVSKPMELSIRDAVKGDLLRKLWAQKKLSDLMVFPDRNKEKILELGKTHGLVTPHTSLIVLESLRQYIEFRIAPPRSSPEMRGKYMKKIDTVEAQTKKGEQDKLAIIRKLWKKRVAWWSREFKYPKGFKYDKKRATTQPGSGGGLFGVSPENIRIRMRALSSDPITVDSDSANQNSNEMGLFDPGAGGSDGGGSDEGESDEKSELQRRGRPAIAIKPWDPKTPYLAALKAAKPSEAFAVYMINRKTYGASPAFFLDCADFFYKKDDLDLAIQILSNIAEMELENTALLRVLGHKLVQQRRFDLAVLIFEKVLMLRREEPQSYRDLAMALARRAFELSCTQILTRESIPEKTIRLTPAEQAALKAAVAKNTAQAKKTPLPKPPGKKPKSVKHMTAADARAIYDRIDADNIRAIELLYKVVTGLWDERFKSIELIVLSDMNRIVRRVKPEQIKHIKIDKELAKLLDADIRIVMTWDADNTDIDMHIVEPSGEEVYFEHESSTIGGALSEDLTQGYGPEEYMVRKAPGGLYTIKADFYGSDSVKVMGAVAVQVHIYTNFGRENEAHESITVRLKNTKDMITIGQIKF
jgi:Ca-activated chloride channel homolog